VDDISTISTIIVTVSVVTGVIFTVLELRHLARTRRTEVIMRIYQEFGQKEWIENVMKVGAAKFVSLQDYSTKYGLTAVLQVAMLFDGVGVLLEEDLIDLRLVNSLFGSSVRPLWDIVRPIVYAIRASGAQPTMFSHFESLYNRLSAYRKEHPDLPT
jgi:hypothetical protein